MRWIGWNRTTEDRGGRAVIQSRYDAHSSVSVQLPHLSVLRPWFAFAHHVLVVLRTLMHIAHSGSNNSQIHNLATRLTELLPAPPVPSAELWNKPSSHALPPPSYDDTIADLPPNYTTTDALASAQTPEYSPWPSLNPSLCSKVPNCLRLSCDTSPASSFYFDNKSLYADIDFGFSEEGVKSHAKKKKAAAPAKKAEEEPPPPPPPPPPEPPADTGGGSGGDAPGDGGAGGAGGGDGGGGGGGGDDDGWGAPAEPKKKKTKKQIKEEEAEKKKKEEEEAAAAAAAEAERIKKEEEDAAAAATAAAEAEAAAKTAEADLSWASPSAEVAPVDDGWGSFTPNAPAAGKKKKKKGKVRTNLGC
jgi:uncharacterized membrane protein YgcG